MAKKIYFLPNGMTAVFDSETQVPELQQPWVELFAEFLETKVQSTTHWELHFPDGRIGHIWRTDEDGSWDWRFLRPSDEGYKAPADAREEVLFIAGSIMGLATRPYDAALDKDERKMLLRAGELLYKGSI
jgi:hypothetical protein